MGSTVWLRNGCIANLHDDDTGEPSVRSDGGNRSGSIVRATGPGAGASTGDVGRLVDDRSGSGAAGRDRRNGNGEGEEPSARVRLRSGNVGCLDDDCSWDSARRWDRSDSDGAGDGEQTIVRLRGSDIYRGLDEDGSRRSSASGESRSGSGAVDRRSTSVGHCGGGQGNLDNDSTWKDTRSWNSRGDGACDRARPGVWHRGSNEDRSLNDDGAWWSSSRVIDGVCDRASDTAGTKVRDGVSCDGILNDDGAWDSTRRLCPSDGCRSEDG